MDQKKTRSYLLYAAGEILLVMIGILLALQINNWNEQRKDRMMEQRFLNELVLDLQSDSLALAQFKANSDEQVRTKSKLRAYYRGTEYSSDSLIIFFENQWKPQYNFNPITTTLDEMRSTGNLSVIRNADLRRHILETYNYYLDFKTFAEAIYSEYQKKNAELYYTTVPGLFSFLDEKDYRVEKALSNYEVQNRLAGNFVLGMNENLEEIIEVNAGLLRQVREEVQRLRD